MAETDPGIDPRYAAQFQRGYDGPVLVPPTTQSPATPTHSTRTAPVRMEGGPPATAARIPDPPHVVARPHVHEEPVDVDEPTPTGTPRTEWALLAVGVVALAAAGWVVWINATDITSYTSTTSAIVDYVWRDTRFLLPGPLVLGGIVSIVAWMVVRALRTRPRS